MKLGLVSRQPREQAGLGSNAWSLLGYNLPGVNFCEAEIFEAVPGRRGLCSNTFHSGFSPLHPVWPFASMVTVLDVEEPIAATVGKTGSGRRLKAQLELAGAWGSLTARGWFSAPLSCPANPAWQLLPVRCVTMWTASVFPLLRMLVYWTFFHMLGSRRA